MPASGSRPRRKSRDSMRNRLSWAKSGPPVPTQSWLHAPHCLQRLRSSQLGKAQHDLQARPVYHHKRESIGAHLTIVFAALAVSHWIEPKLSGSIKNFVRPARRYRTVQIRAGRQILTAADPLPDDLREAITRIDKRRRH